MLNLFISGITVLLTNRSDFWGVLTDLSVIRVKTEPDFSDLVHEALNRVFTLASQAVNLDSEKFQQFNDYPEGFSGISSRKITNPAFLGQCSRKWGQAAPFNDNVNP